MWWHAQIFNLTLYNISECTTTGDLRNFCLNIQIYMNTLYLFSLILQHQLQNNFTVLTVQICAISNNFAYLQTSICVHLIGQFASTTQKSNCAFRNFYLHKNKNQFAQDSVKLSSSRCIVLFSVVKKRLYIVLLDKDRIF